MLLLRLILLDYTRTLKSSNPLSLFSDLSNFLFPVLAEDLTGFLEALVGKLGEGDVCAGCESCPAAAGTDRKDVVGALEFAFGAGGVDYFG